MSPEVLRIIYFSYGHTIKTYGTIFWGNSSLEKLYLDIQKRTTRVLMNSSGRNSCQDLFKKLNILLLQF